MAHPLSILVGPAILDRYPRFVGRLGREHKVRVVGVGEIVTLFQSSPWSQVSDLMLVDRSNLLLSSTWLAALAQLGTDPPPLLVVQHEPPVALQVVAAHAGAAGVIDPLGGWEEISMAIDHAAARRTNLDGDLRIWTQVEQPLNPHGTPIEFRDDIDRDIVDLVSFGLSDREVAAAVHLAEQTVRNRVSRLLEHSGVKNRTQLAVARRRQLESTAMATTFAWYRSQPSSSPEGRGDGD